MSMRTYGFDDYGLILTPFDVGYVANKILDEQRAENISMGVSCDEEDYKPFDLSNENDIVIGEALNVAESIVNYVSEFEGEYNKVGKENGQDCWEDIQYADEIVYYIPVPKYPSFFAKAYNNYDDLINDFKERYGKYLPEDFDYENNFRHIVGTYFG